MTTTKNGLIKRLEAIEQKTDPSQGKTIVLKMWRPDSYLPIESGSRKTRIVPFSKQECEAAEAEAIKNKGEIS